MILTIHEICSYAYKLGEEGTKIEKRIYEEKGEREKWREESYIYYIIGGSPHIMIMHL